jgi:hypothetical protein
VFGHEYRGRQLMPGRADFHRHRRWKLHGLRDYSFEWSEQPTNG